MSVILLRKPRSRKADPAKWPAAAQEALPGLSLSRRTPAASGMKKIRGKIHYFGAGRAASTVSWCASRATAGSSPGAVQGPGRRPARRAAPARQGRRR